MNKNKTKRIAGYTLIELLTVMFIIGVIAAIIIPNIKNAFHRAQVSGCQSNLRNIATALQVYHTDNSDYPEQLSEIVPEYMKEMPFCPSVNKDTYTDGYSFNENPVQYTIYCSGVNHSESNLGENEPYYSLSSGLGP